MNLTPSAQLNLNNLHTEKLLKLIELSVQEILRDFTFEINNIETRKKIANTVSNFLDVLEEHEIIFDHHVIMNDENNPSEMVDMNMGVVDYAVIPYTDDKKYVNRITIFNTGN